jgi:hypothetical protein
MQAPQEQADASEKLPEIKTLLIHDICTALPNIRKLTVFEMRLPISTGRIQFRIPSTKILEAKPKISKFTWPSQTRGGRVQEEIDEAIVFRNFWFSGKLYHSKKSTHDREPKDLYT